MPFTPTHALAVVPAARYLPLSALAVGSMIPDLPLYYDVNLRYETTHSFVGLFSACLPLGLAVYMLFHALVKQPLVALLPDPLRARLRATAKRRMRFSAANVATVVAALLLGALTHIVWDAFTHEGRWGVQALGFLEDTVRIAGVELPGYSIFQHGASVVGLPLLAVMATRWAARQEPAPLAPGMRPVWRGLIAVMLLTLPTLAGVEAIAGEHHATIEWSLFEFVTVGGGTFMLLVLVYGALATALKLRA